MSKTTGIIRKIDDLGRIVLPKEFRDKLNFQDNEKVDMKLVGDTIVLKKSIDSCIKCSAPISELAEIVELNLCDDCLHKFGQKLSSINK